MSTLTRFTLAHRRTVIIVWLAVALIAFAFVSTATKSLSTEFQVPGSDAFKTNTAILRLYGNGGNTPPLVPVITLPKGMSVTSPSIERAVAAAFARVQRALPSARVASFATTGNRSFVSPDGRTTFGLIFAPGEGSGFGPTPGLATVQRILAPVSIVGAHFVVTGIDPLSAGSSSGSGPSVLVETIIGGAGALLVLAFVFDSLLALLPFLMAVVAIPTTFLVVLGLTALTPISFIVEFLISLIGLGIAIDYSLLIVLRWREERANGLENGDAVQRAMETAGSSVVFSGTTVAIGLLALVTLPLPFLRSVGIGGMLIPLVSVAVALTLLPVLLATVGPRLDWPRRRSRGDAGRFWTRWGGGVVRRPRLAVAVALAVLGALLYAGSTISIGDPAADSLAKTGSAHSGLVALESSGIGAGALSPIELLMQRTDPAAVSAQLEAIPGVRAVLAPTSSSWHVGGTALVDVIPQADGTSAAGLAVLDRVRAMARTYQGTVHVGGPEAQSEDFVSSTYGSFPLMVVVIMLLSFLLLTRAFRSVVLALKAVLLNLISVGAAWGMLVLVWQDGFGAKAIWGIQPTGAITSWVPLMVFSFLFGLSMDYEVFLLTRMREEFDADGSTAGAVTRGVGRTGRLITSASLILFLSFLSLTSAPQTQVKMIGTGLAAGILLDATVVRMLLAPALVTLLGRWNWWLPARMARMLRVSPRASSRFTVHGSRPNFQPNSAEDGDLISRCPGCASTGRQAEPVVAK